LTTKLTLRLTY